MNEKKISLTRRAFIRNTTLAAVSLSTKTPASSGSKTIPLCVFSKHLQFLGYEQMAQTAAAAGFDGVDLTVRPGGHVLPEEVEKSLPMAIRAVEREGLQAPMMTTAITSAKDPFTSKILTTARACGIKTYRLGYFEYDPLTPIKDSLFRIKTAFHELAQLNEQIGIHGDYQNHSGVQFGAPLWDLWHILDDLDPEWMGCQYDLKHATAEGGNSWILALELLKRHVRSLAVKDFYWGKSDVGWQEIMSPLGEGMCDYSEFFKRLRSYQFSGPVSMHFEYPMPHEILKGVPQNQVVHETIRVMRRDLTVLRRLLLNSGLTEG